MKENNILGIPLENQTKKNILEKIKKYISQPGDFFHIVSINLEILSLAQENSKFKEVLRTAQIRIRDGAGVLWAAKILGIPSGERYTGVDLMQDLIQYASEKSLSVLLIGERGKIAQELADCYSQKFQSGKFYGIFGYNDVEHPTEAENEHVFTIVRDTAPQIVLASFGSPKTEIWFSENRDKFKGMVCASVGGAFRYLHGDVKRPPYIIRKLGLEFLYRLIIQPWRWRRQLRLFKTLALVINQRLRRERL